MRTFEPAPDHSRVLNTISLLIECFEKKTDQSNAHRHDPQAMKCVPFLVFSSCCFRQRVRTQACHRLLIGTRNTTVNTITTIQMLVAAISKASSGSWPNNDFKDEKQKIKRVPERHNGAESCCK